jgi:hypothetical protein
MSGVRGVGTAAVAGRSGRAAATQGGFSVPTGGTSATGSAGAATPVSLAGLLALQEAGGDAVADREARKRGHDLLTELSALQRDLLDGPPDSAQLQRLEGLLEAIPAAADPHLRAVVDQITLRVRIELVRYGVE